VLCSVPPPQRAAIAKEQHAAVQFADAGDGAVAAAASSTAAASTTSAAYQLLRAPPALSAPPCVFLVHPAESVSLAAMARYAAVAPPPLKKKQPGKKKKKKKKADASATPVADGEIENIYCIFYFIILYD